jgi:hypothetical protein
LEAKDCAPALLVWLTSAKATAAHNPTDHPIAFI